MIPQITWIARYSFTEEPDSMGRWKRHAQIERPDGMPLCIGEVSKFLEHGDKMFTARMFVPQRNGDSPLDCELFHNSTLALMWVEANWENFCTVFELNKVVK